MNRVKVVLALCGLVTSTAWAGRTFRVPMIRHESVAGGNISTVYCGAANAHNGRATHWIGPPDPPPPGQAPLPAGALQARLVEDPVTAAYATIRFTFVNVSAVAQTVHVTVHRDSTSVGSWWTTGGPGGVFGPQWSTLLKDFVDTYTLAPNEYWSVPIFFGASATRHFIGRAVGAGFTNFSDGTVFLPSELPGPSNSVVCQGLMVNANITISVDQDRGAIMGRYDIAYHRSNGTNDRVSSSQNLAELNSGRPF